MLNPRKKDPAFTPNPNNHNLNRPRIIRKFIRVKGDNVKNTINKFLENKKKFVELWRVSGLLMFNFKIKNVMEEDLTIRKLAEKIAKDFQLSVRERTDAILELDSISMTNLGIDSKLSEKKKVKSDSKYLYKLISGFNEKDGNLLLKALDK